MNSLSDQLFNSKDLFQIINCYLTPKELSKNIRVSHLFNNTISDSMMKELLIKSQFKQRLSTDEFSLLSKQSFCTLNDVLQQSRMYDSTKCIMTSRSKFTLPLIFSPNPKELSTLELVGRIPVGAEAISPWALGNDHLIVGLSTCGLQLIKYHPETGNMEKQDLYKTDRSHIKPCILNDGCIVFSSNKELKLLKIDRDSGKFTCSETLNFYAEIEDPCSLNDNFLVVICPNKSISIIHCDKETGKLTICDTLELKEMITPPTYLGKGLMAYGTKKNLHIYLLKFDEKSGKIISVDKATTSGAIVTQPCPINDDTFVMHCQDQCIYHINYNIHSGKVTGGGKYKLKSMFNTSACPLGNNLLAFGTMFDVGSSCSLNILRYDPKSGKMIQTDNYDMKGWMTPPSVIKNGLISFHSGSSEKKLHFIQVDMETGKIRSKQDQVSGFQFNDSSPCALGNDLFAVGTGGEKLSMYKVVSKIDQT